MHKAMRPAGQPWVNTGSEKHTVTSVCKSRSPRVKGIFICGNRMVPSLTIDSLFSHFFIFGLSKPKFGPSIILTCPDFSSFQSQRATNTESKEPSPTAGCHQPFFSQGYRVLRADEVSRTCHTQQITKPECVKGVPGGGGTYSYSCWFQSC